MRDSFVFYRSYRNAAKMLDEHNRATLYDAIADYALDGIEPDLSGTIGAIFEMARRNIEEANTRYDKSIEAGKQGGRPRKWIDQKEAEALFTELGSWSAVAEKLDVAENTLLKARRVWETQKRKNLKNPNVNYDVNDNVNVNDNYQLTNINNKASAGARLEAAPPPQGFEWCTKVVENGVNHYRKCINKITGEERVIQLD